MTNRIAIIDFLNQDIGLKILFPEADYFILEEEYDRSMIYSKYNINPIVDNKDTIVLDTVKSNDYDTLLIIAPLYDALKTYNNKPKDCFISDKTCTKLVNTIKLIKKNNFKNIAFFDNYDYDYDPNIAFDEAFINSYNIQFFKRYYNKEKIYDKNVHPFPYIIFGQRCNIDMITNLFNNAISHNKIPRIFFSGSYLHHIDNVYGIERNRREIINKITNKLHIYNPGHIPHEIYMNEIANSKYCLDLLGVGDPNIRTFEILSCKSLRIAQRSNLKWNFDDYFCEETIFDNENDLLDKIIRLENDPMLYQQCLDKQNEIVRKHMNINSLQTYILDKIL